MEIKHSIEEIFGKIEYHAKKEFNKYISDHEEFIKNFLTDEDNYYLLAGTGSGKTYSLLDIAYRKNIKLIMAVPLQIIAKQKSEEYSKNKKNSYIFYLMGYDKNNPTPWRQTPDYILKQRENEVILSVYNSLYKLIDHEDFTPSKYVLVIDECHNLVNQYGFRYEAIEDMLRFSLKFKKVIYMSGTIEGTKIQDYKVIKFEKNIQTTLTENYFIVKYGEDGLYELVNHLIQNRDKLLFVLYDNTKALDNLKSVLWKLNPKLKIVVFNANRKDNPEYIMLEEKEVISSEYDIILTTRVIAEGANIHNKEVDVYFYNVVDPLTKRQFIGRIRTGVKNVYDFILRNDQHNNKDANTNLNLKSITDIHSEIKIKTEPHLKYSNDFNSVKSLSTKDKKKALKLRDNINKLEQHLYLHKNFEYQLSEYKIRKTILDEVNNLMRRDLVLFQAYLLKYSSIHAQIIDYDKLLESCKFNSDLDKKLFYELYDNSKANLEEKKIMISEYFPNFMTIYKKEYGICEKTANPEYFHRSMRVLENIFPDKNLQEYFLEDTKKLIELLYPYYQFGYPLEFIQQIINSPKQTTPHTIKKNKARLDAYFIYRIIKENGVVLFAERNNLNIVVEIIRKISFHVKGNKNFDIKEIDELLREYDDNIHTGSRLFKFRIRNILKGMYNFGAKRDNNLYDKGIDKATRTKSDITFAVLLIQLEYSAEAINAVVSEEEEIFTAYKYVLTGSVL